MLIKLLMYKVGLGAVPMLAEAIDFRVREKYVVAYFHISDFEIFKNDLEKYCESMTTSKVDKIDE